ncbi:MAG: NAD-dependent malic enzyme [Firmicutes bacterium]|nr:NAD-dependent malic enzyme [Bacillota bacterium]
MGVSLNITIKLKLSNRPGTLAKVLEAIAKEGGSLGAIEMVSASPTHNIRELFIRLKDQGNLQKLLGSVKELPNVQVISTSDRVFSRHLEGKIEIKTKRPIKNWEDLALVYTPGVARISEAIADNKEMATELTMKRNSVAIITDGSAVLGLGNVGPYAGLPVMEGKAALFKQFANIDAFPLCLDASDPDEIISIVAACSPGFGGINLEDIAAPKCFEIEKKLSEMLDIPVFHDDQRGTAVVNLAGLINALKVVGKELEDVQIVISGAGAAGAAISRLLITAGAKNIVVCDRKGAIARDNIPDNTFKQWIAENTNQNCKHGSLKEVIKGVDVFIGVSAPGLLNREDILKMNKKPIVFALANPEPEIDPDEIHDIAGVIATGRSDYPNQINNALAFPGIFRGALDSHATTINDQMCMAAAHALASIIAEEELIAENIIPSIFNNEVVKTVAKAVEEEAKNTGVVKQSLYKIEKDFI